MWRTVHLPSFARMWGDQVDADQILTGCSRSSLPCPQRICSGRGWGGLKLLRNARKLCGRKAKLDRASRTELIYGGSERRQAWDASMTEGPVLVTGAAEFIGFHRAASLVQRLRRHWRR
jgi:hypothetical protein